MTKSLIKFMTKEELVTMLTKIRNFKNPNTGKFLKGFQIAEKHWMNRWNSAEYKFNMKNLDFVDVLICGEGYVRYFYKKNNEVIGMLKERFGFEEE